MSVYHCTPNTTRDNLVRQIRAWIETELGEPQKIFRRISVRGKVVWQLAGSECVEDITWPISDSFYTSLTKITAMNLRGCGAIFADNMTAGHGRPNSLLAVIDGEKRELAMAMPIYGKVPPALNADNEGTLGNHQPSEEADIVGIEWSRCLLGLEEVGFIRAEQSAVWGSVQRRHWAMKRPGTAEHQLRVMFIGLHDDLLAMVERFRLSLPVKSREQAGTKADSSELSESSKHDVIDVDAA